MGINRLGENGKNDILLRKANEFLEFVQLVA